MQIKIYAQLCRKIDSQINGLLDSIVSKIKADRVRKLITKRAILKKIFEIINIMIQNYFIKETVFFKKEGVTKIIQQWYFEL